MLKTAAAMAMPESCGQGFFEINDVPRLIVVKMDFDGIGGATTSLWVDPTDCAGRHS